MQIPKATLGRIVQFTVSTEATVNLNRIGGKRYNVGDTIPGIVVRSGENNVCNLTLFPDAPETIYVPNIPHSMGGQPGTWNWPEHTGETQEAAA